MRLRVTLKIAGISWIWKYLVDISPNMLYNTCIGGEFIYIYIVRVGIRKDATWSYQLKKFKPGELGAWIEEQFQVPGVERITLTNFMEE